MNNCKKCNEGTERNDGVCLDCYLKEQVERGVVIKRENKVRVLLGLDQEGEMEGMLSAISLRTGECLTYDFPYAGTDGSVWLDVLGSKGYDGQLELTDKGWREWEKAFWNRTAPFEEEPTDEEIDRGVDRDDRIKEGN